MPERLQGIVDEADIVVEHELELEADEHRRKHHRKHHQRAQHALATRRLVDQQREPEAEQHFGIQRDRQNSTVRPKATQKSQIGQDVT
jgi:hypothetical protein